MRAVQTFAVLGPAVGSIWCMQPAVTGFSPHLVLHTESAPAHECLLQGPLRQAGSPQITSADSPAGAGAVQVRAGCA